MWRGEKGRERKRGRERERANSKKQDLDLFFSILKRVPGNRKHLLRYKMSPGLFNMTPKQRSRKNQNPEKSSIPQLKSCLASPITIHRIEEMAQETMPKWTAESSNGGGKSGNNHGEAGERNNYPCFFSFPPSYSTYQVQKKLGR